MATVFPPVAGPAVDPGRSTPRRSRRSSWTSFGRPTLRQRPVSIRRTSRPPEPSRHRPRWRRTPMACPRRTDHTVRRTGRPLLSERRWIHRRRRPVTDHLHCPTRWRLLQDLPHRSATMRLPMHPIGPRTAPATHSPRPRRCAAVRTHPSGRRRTQPRSRRTPSTTPSTGHCRVTPPAARCFVRGPRPTVTATPVTSPVPRAEPPDDDASHARPWPAPADVVGVARREPAERPSPDRPVEVHIGTVEITAAAPPPRRTRGAVGFADHERLRTARVG